MRFEICFGKSKDRLPITIINTYIFLTLLLYLIGPVRFIGKNTFFMILYVLFALFFINIGFFRAVKNCYDKYSLYGLRYQDIPNRASLPLPFWFQITGLIITLVMFGVGLVTTGFSGLNGGTLTNAMAKAYTFTQGGGEYQEGIDVPMWIFMHCALFVYLSIVDGIIYWKQLILPRKVIWLITLISLVGYFVLFRGQQKTLGDVFVLIVSALLVKSVLPGLYGKKKRSNKVVFFLIILVIVFAFILATILGSRVEYLNRYGYNAFKLNTEFYNVNLDSGLLQIFPKSTRLGFADLDFYLCNGLCGLSYCLACPPTWSFGIGSVSDLSDILERRTGVQIFENTYMYRAYEMYGYPHSEYWHTIFPSIASDWTFWGALIIVGIYAYIYGKCWEEIIHGKNKESIFFFSALNIIWIYLPANNQIFSTRTTALIFVICFIMWLRRNKNIDKKWFFYDKNIVRFRDFYN